MSLKSIYKLIIPFKPTPKESRDLGKTLRIDYLKNKETKIEL